MPPTLLPGFPPTPLPYADKKRVLLHWHRYSLTERGLLFLPFCILTPRLLNHISTGHNGETSQELIITFALLILLILAGLDIKRNPKLFDAAFKKTTLLLDCMLVFTFWSTLSLGWTTDIGATLDHSVLWINYCAVIFLGQLVLRRRSMFGLIFTLVMTSLLIAIIKLAQYWMMLDERSIVSPIFASIGVETELLVTILPLICSVFIFMRRRMTVIWIVGVVGVVLMGAMSTYQRTPLLALAGGMSFWHIALLFKREINNRWRRLVYLTAALTIFGVCQLVLPSGIKSGIDNRTLKGNEFIVNQVKGIRSMEIDTNTRLTSWGAATEMILAHPFLGIGAGAFKSGYAEYRRRANVSPYWSWVKDYSQADGMEFNYRTHNEFLQIGSELGIVGLTLIGIILLIITLILFQLMAYQRGLSASIGAGGIAFIISSSLASYSFRWLPCGLIFFLLVSLTLPTRLNNILPGLRRCFMTKRIMKYAFIILLAGSFLGVVRTSQVIISEYYQLQAKAIPENRNYEAINLYKKALAIDPFNFHASAELGIVLFQAKQYESSSKYLAYGVGHGINNVIGFAYLANAQAQAGDENKAQAILAEATGVYPTSLFLHALYAEHLEAVGNLPAAQAQWEIARSINPSDAEVWQVLAKQGINAATAIAIKKKLTHPIKLTPNLAVGAMRDYQEISAVK